MDKTYLELFKTLAQSVAVLSERVMDIDREKDDGGKSLEAATKMRDDFQALVERCSDPEVKLTRTEYAQLLVGATVISRNLEAQINQLKKSVDAYQTIVIPRLSRIVNETKTDEEADVLGNELFALDTTNEQPKPEEQDKSDEENKEP